MRWLKWIDTMVAVFVVALVVLARSPSGWAVNTTFGNFTPAANATCGNVGCGSGFTGSYHDFVSGPGAGYFAIDLNGTNTTAYGACTMCHTPHHAYQQTLLWNHHLSNNTNFGWAANATTMAGTPYATINATWAGPTAKCMSCHDGSVAVSTINWFNSQNPIAQTPDCSYNSSDNRWDLACPSYIDFPGGVLTDTHPVAMPYPCNGVGSTYNGVTTGSNGAGIVAAEWVPSPAAPIRIYKQIDANTVSWQSGTCASGAAGIECGSCHDIHNSQNLDVWLVRGYISGSSANYICKECHAK